MRRTSSVPALNRSHRLLTSALIVSLGAIAAKAQSAPQPAVERTDDSSISLAITANGAYGHITNPASFGLFGGGAELSATFYRGFGISANILGLHSGNSGNGVPVNLLVATFGPRYTVRLPVKKHSASVYAEGLVGEANGFSGVYPQTTGAIPSSDAFALQVGGGVDFGLTHHIGLRLLEASWLRSQLPNASTNVQNNFQVGAGVVFHTRAKN